MTTADRIAAIRTRLSDNAADTLSAAGVTDEMIAGDISNVQAGGEGDVLATCLRGAEGTDVISGWREYVKVVVHCCDLI